MSVRVLVASFALPYAAFLIWTQGNYGWATSDNFWSGFTAAGLMGGFAFVALFSPAFGTWTWSRQRMLSLGIWMAFPVAFALSVSMSLTILSVRGEKAAVERAAKIRIAKDAEADIEKLQKQLDDLTYTFTAPAMVSAAELAVSNADAAVKQECGQVGANCRKRQDAKASAIDALADVQRQRGLTVQAEELDKRIAELRSKTSDATMKANPGGEAVALIVKVIKHVEADDVSTIQQLAIVGTLEWFVALMLATVEGMRPEAPAHPKENRLSRGARKARTFARRHWERLGWPNKGIGAESEPSSAFYAETGETAPERVAGTPANDRTAPSEKVVSEVKVTAARNRKAGKNRFEAHVTHVEAILSPVMRPGESDIGMTAVYDAYKKRCAAFGMGFVDVPTFMSAMNRFCEQRGIAMELTDTEVILKGVSIKDVA